jgi:outer membrane immunogenic protein
MKSISIAIALSAITAGHAMAQEKPAFSGARVGVDAGWARTAGGDRIGSDGFTYGISLGYDIATGPVRIGPEIRAGDSTQKDCRRHPAGGPSATECQRSDRDLYAGARLGYVASPQILVFGTFGYANVRFSDRFRDLTVGAVKNIDVARDRGGFRAGAGVEYAITPRIYVAAGYQYSKWKEHVHQNQAQAGLGFRF